MNVLSLYRHMFMVPDLRRKIFFTLAVIAIYRLGTSVPTPGVDLEELARFRDAQTSGGTVALLNLFSGGALEQLSVFALGIMPYITASIIMQLLTVVIPKLQALQEEGQAGQKVITQWTRYVTVVLAIIQSTGIINLLGRPGGIAGLTSVPQDIASTITLVPNRGPGMIALMVLTMTAGTAFIMWLGELITEKGVGNGMSIIIFVSILSQLPSQFSIMYAQTVMAGRILPFVVLVAVFVGMVVAIIYMDQAQRRIPIQFAKRVRGRRVMGGHSTYIPLKVNTAGVIPVIFASSFLMFPALIATAMPGEGRFQTWFREAVNNNLGGGPTGNGQISWWYVVFMFGLIVFFTYFYTQIQFDPARQADLVQRQGGFIPGFRPGRQTEEHLSHILTRITLPGSLFLAIIATMPALVSLIWGLSMGFAGVSILIVVGVALETMKQIESQLTMRNYEGILS